MTPLITLTTDFGLDDTFVGVMKGVILGVAPGAKLVDLTHTIERHAVTRAAWAIGDAYHHFPEGTIHLAVVDPGVGSGRRAIALRADGHLFVGPDNGLFTLPLRKGGVAHQLTNPACHRSPISRTFEGRDLFAPMAAHLAAGVALESLGPPAPDPVTLPLPEPERTGEREVTGEVIYCDRFGNAMTNIDSHLIPAGGKVRVSFGAESIEGLSPSYEAAEGLGAIIGSQDRLEIFVTNGSARDRFAITVGTGVTVTG